MKKNISLISLMTMALSMGIEPVDNFVKKYSKPFMKTCKSCGKEYNNRGKWCKECFDKGLTMIDIETHT